MKWFKPGYIFLAAFAALYLYAWWRNRKFEAAARVKREKENQSDGCE